MSGKAKRRKRGKRHVEQGDCPTFGKVDPELDAVIAHIGMRIRELRQTRH